MGEQTYMHHGERFFPALVHRHVPSTVVTFIKVKSIL